MPRWLLDTNIISQAVRNPHGPLAARIAAGDSEDVCTSAVVVAELRYGLEKTPSERRLASIDAVLGGLTIEPFDASAARAYGELRAALERAGQPLSANDSLIAAHAIALGCTLVTDDGAFSQAPGLAVENWLREPT
jgi:tRNA(fMet)-specific endonuclease VapC